MANDADEVAAQKKKRKSDKEKKRAETSGGTRASEEPLRMLNDVAADQLQPESLADSLTVATARLRADQAGRQAREQPNQGHAPASQLSSLRRDAMHEARRVLKLAAAAPAGHWSGAAAAQLAQCTVVVRSPS